MPKFRQIDQILNVMSRKEHIRNVGIVAHVDHGKTTMTDSLLIVAGLLPPQVAGTARALDYLEEEQKRGITIKTANISLLHRMNSSYYVINLIDTPGHVDFTGKVTRALRATDGVVVVVDAVEEVMAQTETVIRQALDERVRPVLFVNKVDRLIKELRMNAGDIHDKLNHIIDDFNNLIEIYGESEFTKRWRIGPAREAVAFGSALHRWGFTLEAAKQKAMKFTGILNAYADDKYQTLSKTLPLHEAILDIVVKNVPSPKEAQKYRIPKIWKGKLDSAVGLAMLNCDEKGPAVMCATNVQKDPAVGLITTGRVFSGSMKEGDKVYLLEESKESTIQKVSIYMSAFREEVSQVTAGNIAAITGLTQARAGETVVDVACKDEMAPFEPMRYMSDSVMTVAVEPKNPRDLPKMKEAIDRLSIEDPNISITINEKTGEYLLGGLGELHLDVAVKALKDYGKGIHIAVSNPMAEYRESVTAKGLEVMARSPNKHNRFWVQVEPSENKEPKSEDHAENTWVSDAHSNSFVNLSKDTSLLRGVRDAIMSGFSWACHTGPLCEQPLQGVKAKLLQAEIHEDPAFREPKQITRAISRAVLSSFLTAKPVLLEPVYKIEVSAPTQWLGTCTSIITRRRGKIQITKNKGTQTIIIGNIPVAETFGLAAQIRSATSGHAFWQNAFDHWEEAPRSISAEAIRQIRIQKGLPPEIPKPDKFAEEAEHL